MSASKPIDLAALEKLLAQATPGPWRLRYSNAGGDSRCACFTSRDGPHRDREVFVLDGEVADQRMENDLVLVEALRNAAPALLAELRAARAVLSLLAPLRTADPPMRVGQAAILLTQGMVDAFAAYDAATKGGG